MLSLTATAQVSDFVGENKAYVMETVKEDESYAEGYWEDSIFCNTYNDIAFALSFKDNEVVKQVISYPYSMGNVLMSYLHKNYVELKRHSLYADFTERRIRYYTLERKERILVTIHY